MAYDELAQVISVSECNEMIKTLLDESFYQICVKGEISGTYFRPNSSGHYYFDLKDEKASLPSCVFRSFTRGLENFKIGDLVVATGRISLYEKTGKLTFVITKMVKEGDGVLEALIEKRKLYYRNLGCFDEDVKPPLPKSIKKIGIVTSATGAVIHDILSVTLRRAPGMDIILLPSAVQGEGAETTIASRIRQANNFSLCDVLIVARGGGSKEDLMPYNEVEVIEAIHNSSIPVISAVGHESDWSLSDYVATLRAGTPSIAAEIVTKDIFLKRESFSRIKETLNLVMERRLALIEKKLTPPSLLSTLIENKIATKRSLLPSKDELTLLLEKKYSTIMINFSFLEENMNSSIENTLKEKRMKLNNLKVLLDLSIPHIEEKGRNVLREYKKTSSLVLLSRIEFYREKVKNKKSEMSALNPLCVLERGFALVRDKNGIVITSADKIKTNDKLNIRFIDGSKEVVVTE